MKLTPWDGLSVSSDSDIKGSVQCIARWATVPILDKRTRAIRGTTPVSWRTSDVLAGLAYEA